jgi:hypothetical protein
MLFAASHRRLIGVAYGAAVRSIVLAAVAILAAATAACGGSGAEGGAETTSGTTSALPVDAKPFPIDPADFTNDITNPYWPMKPGDHWVYRETNAEGEVQRNDVVVTGKTKKIMGIDAVVVHDTVRLGGELTEDTYDWYAQDADGNLWYLGEDTAEYENGKLKTKEGSWEAGVDGALPGIIMPAHPQVGMTYREEYYKGHAEDGAQIISVDALAKVPYGRFDHGAQTRNFSGIEPDVIEEKIYAKDVGVVLEITVSGGSDRSELVSFTHGG